MCARPISLQNILNHYNFSQYIAPNPQIYYYYSKKTLQPHFILHFHTRFLMFIRDNTIEWTAFDNIYMK